MRYLIVLIFIFSVHLSSAQKLSPEEMRSDIDYYFNQLRDMHPNLYKRYTPEQFDSLQMSLIDHVADSMECRDFNRLMLRVNAYTDGHTNVNINKITEWNVQTKFPYFQVREDSLLLNDNLIVFINDVSTKEIVQELSNMYSWEYSSLLKEKSINDDFLLFATKFYGITPPYIASFKNLKTGEMKKDTLKLVKQVYNNETKFNFEFFEEYSIAVLHYNTCYLGKDEEFFEHVLIEAFRKMKNDHIKYLFIDVTKNGGGSDEYQKYIFKHLNSKKVNIKIVNRINKKCVKELMEQDVKENRKYLASQGTTFMKRLKIRYFIWKLERAKKDFLKTGTGTLKISMPGNTKGFDGKVFVLQGRETFSAAISLVEFFRRQNMGLVVGEQAGEPVCFNGNPQEDVLPYSKIKIRYSLVEGTNYPKMETDENGFLVPDIPYDVYNRELGVEDYLKIIEMSHHLK